MPTKETRPRQRILPILRTLALLCPVWYIGAYFFVALSRVSYPFALEWMEGGSLLQVLRILHGQSIYVKPTWDFIPFIYPPLYFYLSAGLSGIMGPGFAALRAISILASLGSFAVLYLVIYRRTGSIFSALLGTGLFAATFALSAFWFDIGRVDMLYVFFLLSGIHLVSLETPRAAILGGIMLALSFFTKQTGVLIIAAIFAFYLAADRAVASRAIGSFALATIPAGLLLNLVTDGWFGYYVFTLPALHRFLPRWPLLLGFFLIFFGERIVLALSAGFSRLLIERRRGFLDRRYAYYVLLSASAIMTALLAKANPGGFDNVLIPAYALTAVVFGLGLDWLMTQPVDPHLAGAYQSGICLLCILQFLLLGYRVGDQIPSQADRQAGMQLVDQIGSIQGQVWIPADNYLSVMAGKSAFAQRNAILEIYGEFGEQDRGQWIELQRQLDQMLDQGAFAAIIRSTIDVPGGAGSEKLPDDYLDLLLLEYQESQLQYGPPGTFWPKAGLRIKPGFIYYRIP